MKREQKKIRGVYERVPGSNEWWIRFTQANGKLRREKAGTKAAAIKLIAVRRAAVLEGRKLPDTRAAAAPTLREFSKTFAESTETRSAAKPRTIKFYSEQVKRLLEYAPLADARLNEIDEALVERFVQHRSGQHVRRRTKDGLTPGNRRVSTATVNRSLATLRRMMRLALKWKLVTSVPEIRLLSGEHNREYVLSHADEKRYLEAASQPLRDIATLIIDTGTRLGEALAIEWDDVHLIVPGSQWGCIIIRQGKSKNARRAIPLTKRVHMMLTQHKKDAGHVFGDQDGTPYAVTRIDRLHAATRKALGFPSEFVLHSLRHTYLTRLGLSGADAFTIMRLAGHSSVSVSQRYVHPTPAAMEDAVSRLDKLNTRSLESNTEGTEQPATEAQAPVLTEGPTGTPTDTDLLPHPQVIDGRVAQLAEQLTLNQ